MLTTRTRTLLTKQQPRRKGQEAAKQIAVAAAAGKLVVAALRVTSGGCLARPAKRGEAFEDYPRKEEAPIVLFNTLIHCSGCVRAPFTFITSTTSIATILKVLSLSVSTALKGDFVDLRPKRVCLNV